MDKKTHFRREREVVDLLLKEKAIDQGMLQKAREECQRTGLNIRAALDKLGFMKEEDLIKIQAQALGIPSLDLTNFMFNRELIAVIPRDVARQYQVVPLFRVGPSLTVGMVDPQDIMALDHIRRICKIDMIEPILVSERGLNRILDSFYEMAGSIQEVIRSLKDEKLPDSETKGLSQMAEGAQIIKLVNLLISQAARDRASDIHMEPDESCFRIRVRVDGILSELATLPKKLQNIIVSRTKIMAGLDIAESRKPQDGRIRMDLEDRKLDIRISTFPTVQGENVVMRLLDKTSVVLGLKEMGFSDGDLVTFDKLILSPHGIIFISGPTGSGKTTTLYAALTALSSIEKNIVTIEDPVEYEFPIIRQTQVNVKAGITFSSGLRSILRQDPDIIMVGEIRDKETSEVAIQAALTGHLVFSTLHTNDAPSALTRLVDMGVESFLISSSTLGIVAQRLVRRVCPNCKEKYEPIMPSLKKLGEQFAVEFVRGVGCPTCKNTGYSGRTGIFEVLLMNEEIRKLVDARKSADEIKKVAISQGMKTLFQDGMEKVRQGMTTIEEVLRVTSLEQERGEIPIQSPG